MSNKLYKFEVTYETKDILGICKHKQIVIADNEETACWMLKARVKRLNDKRAYKLKAKVIEELL